MLRFVLIFTLFLSSAHANDLNLPGIKGSHSLFKDAYKHLSPANAYIAWQTYIKNIMELGEFANDPVAQLLKILFSPDSEKIDFNLKPRILGSAVCFLALHTTFSKDDINPVVEYTKLGELIAKACDFQRQTKTYPASIIEHSLIMCAYLNMGTEDPRVFMDRLTDILQIDAYQKWKSTDVYVDADYAVAEEKFKTAQVAAVKDVELVLARSLDLQQKAGNKQFTEIFGGDIFGSMKVDDVLVWLMSSPENYVVGSFLQLSRQHLMIDEGDPNSDSDNDLDDLASTKPGSIGFFRNLFAKSPEMFGVGFFTQLLDQEGLGAVCNIHALKQKSPYFPYVGLIQQFHHRQKALKSLKNAFGGASTFDDLVEK